MHVPRGVVHDASRTIRCVTPENSLSASAFRLPVPAMSTDIDIYSDFMRLRGKTYDYRVTYQQVQRLFLLPKPDDTHTQLVVNIDPPIRQGQTRYPYLVMQFIKDEHMELEINLDE